MLDSVIARVAEVQTILAAKGFPKVDIKVEIKPLAAGVAGVAYVYQKRIALSQHFLKEHPESMLKETVAHEVCHVYTKHYKPFAKQAHGPEFRAFMSLLGLDGKTYHSMSLQNGPVRQKRIKTRFIYTSNQTGATVYLTKQQHMKMSFGIIRYMAKNGEDITYSGKIAEYK